MRIDIDLLDEYSGRVSSLLMCAWHTWVEPKSKPMKKLTLRYKRWLRRRSINEAKRQRVFKPTFVRVWISDEVVPAVALHKVISPPTVWCFDKNFEETCFFLQKLRKRLLSPKRNVAWVAAPSGRSQFSKISGFMDFSLVEEMSTSAALVLCAEYVRAAVIVGRSPPLINLEDWKQPVFGRLFDLGFFDALKIEPEQIPQKFASNDSILTLRFLSGSNAEETKAADEALMELARFIDPQGELPPDISLALNSALSEAMVNVKRHAYPRDHRFAYRHVGRWWLAGSANRANRTLTISIYDQGASIPVTYQRLELQDKVREFIAQIASAEPDRLFKYDGRNIEAAVRYGRSQIDAEHHGNGLPQMKEVIDLVSNGQLRILSRGGEYIYNRHNGATSRSHRASIGGTLIEWTVQLPGGRLPL